MTAQAQEGAEVPVKISFPALVATELHTARCLFPKLNSSHEAYAVILEELDEFWDQVKLKQDKRSPWKLLKELMQVAAMCQRAAEDLNLLKRAHDELLRKREARKVREPGPVQKGDPT